MEKILFSGIFWRLLEKIFIRVFTFVVTILVARIVTPDEYGTIAIILSMVEIFSIFIDFGLGNSLIQKKDSDDLDFSSVFCVNLPLCVFLYIALFFLAPVFAQIYEDPQMTSLIRVSGLTLIFASVKNIQQAYIAKTFQFQKFFYCSLIGTVVSGVVAIAMAYSGFGIWSLVALNVVDCAMDTVAMLIFVKWKPSFKFSSERIKPLLDYGWKLVASSLLNTLLNKVYSLLIGKFKSKEQLAYYDKGGEYPMKISNGINSSLYDVLIPVLAKKQNDIVEIKRTVREILVLNFAIMTPVLIGIAAAGDNIIHILLTDKWMPALPYLRLACIICIFLPIHSVNLSAIRALGKSDYFLYQEFAKTALSFIPIYFLFQYNVFAMACSMVVFDFVCQVIDTWMSKKIYKYSYMQQLLDVLPTLIICIIMGISVYAVNFLNIENTILTLVIQVVVGVVVYTTLTLLFNRNSIMPLFGFIKSKLSHKKEVNSDETNS